MKKHYMTACRQTWVALLLIAFSVFTQVSHADVEEIREFYIQHVRMKYFDTDLDARSLGMGGSPYVSTNRVYSMLGNPAGIGWLVDPEITATMMVDEISGEDLICLTCPKNTSRDIDGDRYMGSLLYANPFNYGNYGVLGMGLQYYDLNVNDNQNTETEGYWAHLAYAKEFGTDWSLAYMLSYRNDSEDNRLVNYDMDDGLRHTLGIQYWPHEDILFGLSLFYGFGDIDSHIASLGIQDGDRESYGASFGFSWRVLEWTKLSASIDYTEYIVNANIIAPNLNQNVDEDGQSWAAHVGIEHEVVHNVFLRAGYHYREIDYEFMDAGLATSLTDNIAYHAPSAGIGWRINEHVSLDYGFEYRFIGNDDMTHALSLTYHF